MLTGSCLCNAVHFAIEGDVDRMSHCHCSMCRKAHGAAFATYVSTTDTALKFVAGENQVAHYESSPDSNRAFCRGCGSVMPCSLNEGRISLAAGTLNEDLGDRGQPHIFVREKIPWLDIDAKLPQFDTFPSPSDGPVFDSPVVPAQQENGLRGSCLCGVVRYEITGPIKAAYHCHCSRCRKARSAAHASNGFCSLDDAVFTAGEDNVKTFKLPEAERFGVAFCRSCGSGVLRRVPELGHAVIPLGALDDQPATGPGSHIFVASKADWYRIPDQLPRHDEGPPR